MSRGIAENWLIISDLELARLLAEADTDVERHDTGIDPDEGVDVDEDLVERMSTSRAKHLAHSIDPDLDAADQLARSRPLAELEERLAVARQAARLATRQHGYSAGQLRQQLAAVEHTAQHIAVGVRVRPTDRHNVGTVTAIDDNAGQAVVWFVSPDGREADKVFGWQHLVIIDRGVARHDLSPAAGVALHEVRARIERRLSAWSATVTALGSYPGEDEQMDRAIRQHIAARTARLAGAQPDWLDQLIGPRPADPVGAGTWDSLVADIARWRSRHHTNGDGIGPPPDDTGMLERWQDLNGRLASTRRWLLNSNRHEPSWPAARSHPELLARRRALEEVFDAAPPDSRPIIDAVRAGQLTLTDVDELVREATTARDARKQWILEHWPHVVEYDEINTLLTEGRWGPDRHHLLGHLDRDQLNEALSAAIRADEPWLQAALCAIDADDDAPLTSHQLAWINAAANHRAEHGITIRDPLGPIPTDRNQLAAFDALLADLHHLRTAPDLEHEPEREDLGIEI